MSLVNAMDVHEEPLESNPSDATVKDAGPGVDLDMCFVPGIYQHWIIKIPHVMLWP